jgi:4-amino-4-deoxy-L-arabinose transferase-like glycosyltransferase
MVVEERARNEGASRPKVDVAASLAQPGLPTILGLFAAFATIWAVYFSIAEAPMAIKHDMAEAYAWGQEFQLGYNQHPPFWAWVCGLWFQVFPRTSWAFALLSSTNAAIGLWGAWMLIGNFATGRKRVAAWALLLLTPFYTFFSYNYNANIIFLSIWPWTLHYFMRSVRRPGLRDAILFGVLIGLALMSKYYAVILAATCLLVAIQHHYRRYFASASPYVSAIVAAVICAPHVWWLATHRSPPLEYLAALSGQGWDKVFGYSANTLVGAVTINLGVVFLVGLIARTSADEESARFVRTTPCPERRVLAILALAPLVLTIVGGLALRTRITPEMTMGTFALLPLLTIEALGARGVDRLCRISVRLAGALTLGALMLSPVIAAARTYLSPRAMGVPPYQEIAVQATQFWHKQTSLPLLYVAGSDWYENAIAFYGPDRSQTFVHFDYGRNLWVTPELLARHGLLSVCVSTDRFCLAQTAAFALPGAAQEEVSLAHRFWGHVAKPVQFIVTAIPPRN